MQAPRANPASLSARSLLCPGLCSDNAAHNTRQNSCHGPSVWRGGLRAGCPPRGDTRIRTAPAEPRAGMEHQTGRHRGKVKRKATFSMNSEIRVVTPAVYPAAGVASRWRRRSPGMEFDVCALRSLSKSGRSHPYILAIHVRVCATGTGV